jgi:hypothetical protein
MFHNIGSEPVRFASVSSWRYYYSKRRSDDLKPVDEVRIDPRRRWINVMALRTRNGMTVVYLDILLKKDS